MQLNDYIRTRRQELNISQIEFYKDLLSRSTADKFEKYNTSVLKIHKLPEIADRLDISFKELIHATSESFLSDFDRLNNRFLTISQQLANNSIGEIELSDSQISELISEIEAMLPLTIEMKDTSSKYSNLYFLIKISFSSMSNKIIPVDQTDLLFLKKKYKHQTTFNAADYKILVNLVTLPIFTVDDLDFLYKKLYPIQRNSPFELIETSHLVIANIITKHLRAYNFTSVRRELINLKRALDRNPSYRYSLIYLHDKSLLDFLESQYTNAESLSAALQYVNIIEECEPEGSTTANRMREATVNLVEKRSESMDVISIIATTKNSIDFQKNIPSHLIKE